MDSRHLPSSARTLSDECRLEGREEGPTTEKTFRELRELLLDEVEVERRKGGSTVGGQTEGQTL